MICCQVTTTVKTAGFRGETLFFRCDREPQHQGQHHGMNGTVECFWGLTPAVDPMFPDAVLVEKIDREFR